MTDDVKLVAVLMVEQRYVGGTLYEPGDTPSLRENEAETLLGLGVAVPVPEPVEPVAEVVLVEEPAAPPAPVAKASRGKGSATPPAPPLAAPDAADTGEPA